MSIASADCVAKVWSNVTTSGGNSPGRLSGHHQPADDPIFAQDRHGQRRAHLLRQELLAQSRAQHVRDGEIRDLERLPRGPGAANGAFAEAEPGGLERRGRLVGHAVGCANLEDALDLVELVDHAAVRAGQAGGVPDDRRQHLLKVERRRERLPHCAERLQLADPVLKLLEEAGVLDRDHGLVRERLQQRNLALGERSHLEALHTEATDRSVAANERYDDERPRIEQRLPVPGPWIFGVELGSDIVDVDRPAFQERPARHGIARGGEARRLAERFLEVLFATAARHPDADPWRQESVRLTDLEDHAAVGIAKSGGCFQDRFECRLEIRRRGRDDAQDLGRRGLLLQRLGDLSVALLQLGVALL